MVKVRIDFPQDIAEEKVEEAKLWEPGQPMKWECEEYNVKETIKKVGDGVLVETEHISVVLNKKEIDAIKKL